MFLIIGRRRLQSQGLLFIGVGRAWGSGEKGPCKRSLLALRVQVPNNHILRSL